MVVFAQVVRTAAGEQWGSILYSGVRRARPAACRAMMLLVFAACLAAAAAAPNDTPATTVPTTLNTTTEILKASETGDPKVDIVKQIRRLNDDGSYTVGYEAGDGTFKIESRDVLGNVKGTFGYIDKDGEIKRVTYSSSSEPTPVPVTTTTTNTPTMTVRMNKTVSSTTRRPLGTVVYPTRSGGNLRSTSTPLPRRRPIPARTTTEETTTEKVTTVDDASSNILNLYKAKSEDGFKPRSHTLKPDSKDDLLTRATTSKTPHTIKPVYETTSEKEHVVEINKANTIRRELTGTSSNPHMISLRQSSGDDSTDVYGSHLSLGTVRPLFTTTTPRPKLVPIHSLVAARQKIQQQYQEIPVQEEETTVEASTGRVFEQDSIVTTNRVPVLVQSHREHDDRAYEQPFYRRPASVHFRTNEYLRDNPGAPVPIGNQRPFLHYELQNKVLEQQQYVKEPHQQQQQSKESVPEGNTVPPYDVRQVTRIIPVHVDDRGVPVQEYQPRFPNYRPSPLPPLVVQPRYKPNNDMNSIQAPVSTRDLRRLLQILILRQNRLQAIMDQLVSPGPPYQTLPPLRHDPTYDYRYQNMRRQYHDDEDRYDYRYDAYRQQPSYSTPVGNYEGSQYESQRYIPRRRLYPRPYDTVGAASNNVEDGPEYLPADIREALLLKMLILAISPDFMPTTPAVTEMTTATPTRKQVRNIQILGEEGTTEMKRTPRQ